MELSNDRKIEEDKKEEGKVGQIFQNQAVGEMAIRHLRAGKFTSLLENSQFYQLLLVNHRITPK